MAIAIIAAWTGYGLCKSFRTRHKGNNKQQRAALC